ncbi:Lanthionine synthetase C-like protein [Rhizophagus irregularis]|uniref:Uncharacterized protein n=3 Tax=Rhizophagus irregularis TaxID=588596 RepID=U9UG51_RHIID|nr:hypothetical protein GLOIN_2v1569786 [Rhizophagus irregularis DAOM 181602=DAOM 197198]EXX76153.1 hypothetical protein RirG_035630 [Rhizophagus irregularis DAOM 197198w]PKC15196.1 Lanthionine synthetase C-like protein [Rhizophagus irregularis]PKC75567.1 Lanthionine synthetase C-like protein [Rhizophagus irregularis]PKY13018.1 Lanthionine synthetase C-like protein [Rhizophagus irregularis]POG75019.1 hypothetical protein GLOIN_2v1569786 [Rhizophagus irregularis DAOM 181602=DAOM 197198]|eukprot:XP_025181885.1 hypothetical protein GLOIN_2v1569786 [Rhizophagus irregularis DAOM 181602=DAOM 197198]
MYFEEKTIIDTTFHQIITTEHKRILCDALLKQCNKILKEIPPNNNYQYWDVYTGTAGLSLLFLKLHERDPGLMFGAKSTLTIADEYIDKALTTYMGQNKLTFDGLPNAIEHECSFLCTVVGLYAVAAQVKHHTGDQESSKRYLDLIQSRYLKAALSPKTPNELFYGRAGYLYSLRYISGLINLMEEDKENPVSQISQIISSVIECIIEDGKRTAVSHQATSYTPLLWIWLDYPYVGASHGFAGILTMLLQFPKQCQEYMSLIKNTTDYILFKCRQVNGNWPSILSETSNDFIQFCHGAPGICFLACKAYEVFEDEEYLNLAKEIADYTYLHGRTRKGVGLCHGISGNAYPFLSVYQLTKDQKYLQYAFEYAEICINWEMKTNREEFVVPDRPWSIFEGLGGSAWLIADLLYWDREVFKGFSGLTDV